MRIASHKPERMLKMKLRLLSLSSVLVAVVLFMANAGAWQPAAVAGSELPKAKQTTLGLYVTAAQAYEMWKAAPETVKVIDVRTPEE